MTAPRILCIDSPYLHLLPGDAYPGLLDGWFGPIIADGMYDTALEGVLVGPDTRPENKRAGPWEVYRSGGWMGMADDDEVMSVGPGAVRLDLRRPECAHRARDVLAAAVRCDICDGGTLRLTSLPPGDPRVVIRECEGCNGTGYRIAPADLGWTRDLPAWQAAAILAASVLRVVAGEGPVRMLVGGWRREGSHAWRRRLPHGHDGLPRNLEVCGAMEGHDGRMAPRFGAHPLAPAARWLVKLRYAVIESGPESGPSGRTEADAAALRAGYALDNDDHLLVPGVDGAVYRVEAP